MGSNANALSTFGLGVGANVETAAAWASDSTRLAGFVAGLAQSKQVNTAMRQAMFVSSMIAQFTADYGTSAVVDDGNVANFEQFFMTALGTLQQNQTFIGFDDTGAADALVITPSPVCLAYASYLKFAVKKIAGANATTTPTLNVSGLGAKTIVRRDGTALAIGDLEASGIYEFQYDGTHFRVCGFVVSDVNAKPLYGLTALPATTFNVVSSGSPAHDVTTYGTVTNGLLNSTFASGILTIGAGDAGWYNLTAYMGLNLAKPGTSGTSTDYGYSVSIATNIASAGYISVAGFAGSCDNSTVFGPFACASGVFRLNVSDLVKVGVVQNSGVTQNDPCGFSAVLIGR